MTDSVLKHTDDEGTLSIFASGDEILFACSKGHWWIVDATSSGRAGKAAALRAKNGTTTQKLTADDHRVQDLTSRFGTGVLHAMRFK